MIDVENKIICFSSFKRKRFLLIFYKHVLMKFICKCNIIIVRFSMGSRTIKVGVYVLSIKIDMIESVL